MASAYVVFRLEIFLGNDAMKTKRDIAKTLRQCAQDIEGGQISKTIMDENGNSVGSYNLATRKVGV